MTMVVMPMVVMMVMTMVEVAPRPRPWSPSSVLEMFHAAGVLDRLTQECLEEDSYCFLPIFTPSLIQIVLIMASAALMAASTLV